MAFSANGTKLADLFDPQVIGDMIDVKLIDAIKLAPLAKVDTTLVGRPGSTILLPKYAYIGAAVTVAEAADIPIKKLSETTTPVAVYKVGNGVQITDEAVLSGYGDPIGEAAMQLTLSIADTVDTNLMTALDGNTVNVHTYTGNFNADVIADALVKFGEDIDGAKALLINPTEYAVLRKNGGWVPASEVAAGIALSGTVGYVQGCQVVVTNRVTAGSAQIVKPGALAMYLKRDTLVETDRDIINKSTVITADKHFATYLLDPSKAIKITA